MRTSAIGLSELHILRDLLMHKYGRDYSAAIMENRDGVVSERVRLESFLRWFGDDTPLWRSGSRLTSLTYVRCGMGLKLLPTYLNFVPRSAK